jgi:hypothetical protein
MKSHYIEYFGELVPSQQSHTPSRTREAKIMTLSKPAFSQRNVGPSSACMPAQADVPGSSLPSSQLQ